MRPLYPVEQSLKERALADYDIAKFEHPQALKAAAVAGGVAVVGLLGWLLLRSSPVAAEPAAGKPVAAPPKPPAPKPVAPPAPTPAPAPAPAQPSGPNVGSVLQGALSGVDQAGNVISGVGDAITGIGDAGSVVGDVFGSFL